MNFDDLENELRNQPVRPLPPRWREGILAAAEQQRSLAQQRCVEPTASGLQRVEAGWRLWLWPCPQAWLGLAATWLILLALNPSPESGRGIAAKAPIAPNPEALQEVAAQKRELARLLDLPAGGPVPPKAPAPLRPRSETLLAPKV
jgi:hypothetical protein